MSYSGLAPRNWSSWAKTKSQGGHFRGRERQSIRLGQMSVVSTGYGASIEVASGIFLANGHLSKALTSGAQALLLNHSLSGSCPPLRFGLLQVEPWALASVLSGNRVKVAPTPPFHGTLWHLTLPPALPASSTSVNPSSVCFLSSEISRWKEQHPPVFRSL